MINGNVIPEIKLTPDEKRGIITKKKRGMSYTIIANHYAIPVELVTKTLKEFWGRTDLIKT